MINGLDTADIGQQNYNLSASCLTTEYPLLQPGGCSSGARSPDNLLCGAGAGGQSPFLCSLRPAQCEGVVMNLAAHHDTAYPGGVSWNFQET